LKSAFIIFCFTNFWFHQFLLLLLGLDADYKEETTSWTWHHLLFSGYVSAELFQMAANPQI
jgi:hypothetical protein